MKDIASAKLTGNPGPSGWSQVHEFTPQEPEKINLRGQLFAVVGTSIEKDGVDSISAGRELLARLHEEYFGKIEASAFSALKSSVETVVKEFEETWADLEIAAVCVLGDVVYSVAAGGAQVTIVRGGAQAKILTSQSKEVTSASGYPKNGDFLIFGTKKFFQIIDPLSLKEGLEAGGVSEAAEAFAPKAHANESSGNLGAILLQFKDVLEKPDQSAATSPIAQELPKETTLPQPKLEMSGFLLKAKNIGREILKKLPERKIYVKPESSADFPSDNKKTTLTVGALILVLLVVSIVFGIRQKGIKEARGKYAERLAQAEHSYGEALSLGELNPERARELFLEARTTAQALKDEGIKDKRLDELFEKINSSGGNILGEYADEPELFLDLSLLTSGFNGDDLAASGDNLFILDKNARRVVRIEVGTKKTETVAGPDDIDSAERIAGYEDRAFVLGEDGIYEVGENEGRVIEASWEGEVLPYSFGANMYVLEKGAGIIWRYPGDGTSFGERQNWFGEGVSPNFAGVVSFTIDGTILVLSDNGRIQKFSQGSPQNFSPQGVNPALSLGTAIHTDEENNFVYVLDGANKRVVVLGKDGEYAAQYVHDRIGEATDLVVSESEGKIILLAGSRLYSLPTKHL